MSRTKIEPKINEKVRKSVMKKGFLFEKEKTRIESKDRGPG